MEVWRSNTPTTGIWALSQVTHNLCLAFPSFVLSVSLRKPVLAVSKIQEEKENDLKVGSEKHR